MHIKDERGVALVLALLLTSVMSVVAASLMFLSQTETYATQNYRMMSQARYAGEAAVHRAGTFLLDSTQYQMPGSSAADQVAWYDTTKSPVLCLSGCAHIGQPVVLSATATKDSNYPAAA